MRFRWVGDVPPARSGQSPLSTALRHRVIVPGHGGKDAACVLRAPRGGGTVRVYPATAFGSKPANSETVEPAGAIAAPSARSWRGRASVAGVAHGLSTQPVPAPCAYECPSCRAVRELRSLLSARRPAGGGPGSIPPLVYAGATGKALAGKPAAPCSRTRFRQRRAALLWHGVQLRVGGGVAPSVGDRGPEAVEPLGHRTGGHAGLPLFCPSRPPARRTSPRFVPFSKTSMERFDGGLGLGQPSASGKPSRHEGTVGAQSHSLRARSFETAPSPTKSSSAREESFGGAGAPTHDA